MNSMFRAGIEHITPSRRKSHLKQVSSGNLVQIVVKYLIKPGWQLYIIVNSHGRSSYADNSVLLVVPTIIYSWDAE